MTELVWFENLVILIEGPEVYVETIVERSGYEIQIHGRGKAELFAQFISRRTGDRWTMGETGAAVGKRGEWDVIHVDFQGSSVARLKNNVGTT